MKEVTVKQERAAWIALRNMYRQNRGLFQFRTMFTPVPPDYFGLCTFVQDLRDRPNVSDVRYRALGRVRDVIFADLKSRGTPFLYGIPTKHNVSKRLAYLELQILCLED